MSAGQIKSASSRIKPPWYSKSDPDGHIMVLSPSKRQSFGLMCGGHWAFVGLVTKKRRIKREAGAACIRPMMLHRNYSGDCFFSCTRSYCFFRAKKKLNARLNKISWNLCFALWDTHCWSINFWKREKRKRWIEWWTARDASIIHRRSMMMCLDRKKIFWYFFGPSVLVENDRSVIYLTHPFKQQGHVSDAQPSETSLRFMWQKG